MEAILRRLFTNPTPAEPPPCIRPFSAEADGLHCYWRGWGPNVRSNSLSVYECSIEQWCFKPTTGPAHPGLYAGCSVCVGRCLYTFGGWDRSTYFNDLSKLDLDTLQWSKVQTTGSQPIRKEGCGLVSVDERTLCCIGGYGIGPTQPGSTLGSLMEVDGQMRFISLICKMVQLCSFRLCTPFIVIHFQVAGQSLSSEGRDLLPVPASHSRRWTSTGQSCLEGS